MHNSCDFIPTGLFSCSILLCRHATCQPVAVSRRRQLPALLLCLNVAYCVHAIN